MRVDSRALVQRFINPKGHCMVRKVDSPKGQWSEVSVAKQYFENQTKGHMYTRFSCIYGPNMSKSLIFQELYVDFSENVQQSASLHRLVISD